MPSLRRNKTETPIAIVVLLLVASACSQTKTAAKAPPSTESYTHPLPQDQGTAGLQQELRRLNTTARLMMVVAHPDDEDGGMLTLESRGQGVSTLLLTLNRGEGGQNKLGSNLFDVLGVLRTLELTAADRYYGVDQRFTRVADFGYSKNPEETFQKWQGHDIPLADIVRTIRTFRPDVLVARFSGTDRDGHGHHQASAILTREAFRAAADPKRFPEQIKEGLSPWQAKKLYIGNVCGYGASSCPDADWTLKLNTGAVDPLLGTSYADFAMRGLKHQLSQGAGGWTVEPGDRFTFYRLVDSVLPSTLDMEGHEKSFFDGIDTAITGLASGFGEKQDRSLRQSLKELQQDIDKAKTAAATNPPTAVQALLGGSTTIQTLLSSSESGGVSKSTKQEMRFILAEKEDQLRIAANLAAGVQLQAEVDAPVSNSPETAYMAVPGRAFRANTHFSSQVSAKQIKISLQAPDGWTVKTVKSSASGDDAQFEVTPPQDAKLTRPYWHRDNPETEALNHIDDESLATLPFPPPPLIARASFVIDGRPSGTSVPVVVKYREDGKEKQRVLAVAPAFSVLLDPGEQVIPVQDEAARPVTVSISSNLSNKAKGTLRLSLPEGWRSEPRDLNAEIPAGAVPDDFQFKVFPKNLREGRSEIRATLEVDGRRYVEGYSVVTRPDLDTFYYYQPALQKVSVIDVALQKKLRVGYLMGAGDEIPTVLRQLGVNVTEIAPDKLASADLSLYDTIIVGIRAYDTQPQLVANHRRLLDFVQAGGALVVQYNSGVGDFNGDRLTPYPAKLARGRVSVEEAPIEILDPENAIFHRPNQITQADFAGWVQERGLYFMDQWDSQFTPLLGSHDPGEPDLKGGLIEARYGKGIYIYTGYAFFRQLPAGVPGAVRLFVNLISAGHETN